jgi:hypothetical protein
MVSTFAPSPDDGGPKPPIPKAHDNFKATAIDVIEDSKLFVTKRNSSSMI